MSTNIDKYQGSEELLEKLVEQSDNELDDKALAIVKKGLGV